ncbi:MAG: SMP-30/gluconolactonase/LRE family protein, partial [Pseudonocardia sediminis]
GSTLVVAETFGNRMSAFDIADDGSLSDRRDWASFGPLPSASDALEAIGEVAVGPDGISVADAEGAIWVADAKNNRAVRVLPGGEIADSVGTEANGCYAVALGGADGRTLFLCVAPNFFEHERRETRDAKLLSVQVTVPAKES